MRRDSVLFAILLACMIAGPAAAQRIFGSGSTFVYPVLGKWAELYQTISGIHIDYQPIGSSSGITEIRSGVVDFGGTDAPLVDAQLLRDGLAQFPLVIGGIVPIVNLDGIAPGQLRLTGSLLAGIYLAKIRNWNDPAIAAVNPGLTLPERNILVVHRSDGSGTTFNWSDYLSKVRVDWSAKVGAGTKVAWPTGVGGKGNGGVAEMVARVKGAIGYVDYDYAVQHRLSYGLVQNQAGNFVPPATTSFQAALKGIDWAKERDFFVLLADSPEPNAYPIMATSFTLMRKYPADGERQRDMLAFFRWALEHGQDVVRSLNHLPLPQPLVQQVEEYWTLEGP